MLGGDFLHGNGQGSRAQAFDKHWMLSIDCADTSYLKQPLVNWTGAPGSHQRTWAENGFFECFYSMGNRTSARISKALEGLPSDFL
jgi:hypothetical protein